jgi:WhiB family transcriptional regulator, redox-sensing transcriptional regulator
MAREPGDPGWGLAAVRLHHGDPPDGDVLLALLDRPPWQADAACREHPEIDWFPSASQSIAPAKRVCAGCLVRSQCEQWAVPQGAELWGIWGGLSQRERIRLNRSRAEARIPPDEASLRAASAGF